MKLIDYSQFRSATFFFTQTDFLKILVDKFENQSQRDIRQAIFFLESGDYDSYSSTLHRSIGAAITLGANRYAYLCRTLRFAEPRLLDGTELHDQLSKVLEESIAELRHYIAHQGQVQGRVVK